MHHHEERLLAKTPIAPRSLARVVVAVFVGWSGSAAAAPEAERRPEPVTWSEADVIARVHHGVPALAVRAAEVEVAAAEARAAARRPDPSIAWDREHAPVTAGGRVDTLALRWPIAPPGRRRLAQAEGRAELAEARAAEVMARGEVVLAALTAFYQGIAAEAEHAVAAAALTRLEEAARVAGRSQAAGASAGYDVTRLELEVELARADLASTQATARAARADLGRLLGTAADDVRLGGTLVPATPTPPPLGATHPAAQAWRAAATASAEAVAASRSAWWPTVDVTGGVRMVGGEAGGVGYVAGVALSLPVFSRAGDAAAAAAARARRAAAAVRLVEGEAQARVGAARAELAAARQALAVFQTGTGSRLEQLARAAAAAYREGERPLIELLDAQRTETAVARRRIELEWAVRRAELAVRAALGEFQ